MRLDPHGGDGDPQNWKRRHFILNGPELLYFQPHPKPEEGKLGTLLGSLSLPGCTAHALLPEEIGGALYAFEVECGETGKVIELRATSALDMAEWLEKLHQASESPIDLHKFHEIEKSRGRADPSVAGEQSTVNHNSHADSTATTPTAGDAASGDREGHAAASPPRHGAGGVIVCPLQTRAALAALAAAQSFPRPW